MIVITAFGNLSTAVRAVENGAFDYLTKPFDLGQALEAVKRRCNAGRRRNPPRPPTPTRPARKSSSAAAP